MRIAAALLLLAGSAGALDAQRASTPHGAPFEAARPSRADSLLARGRLRAAEDLLYAAVAAAPRSPVARGTLGRYLASRGRFAIAEVLYEEAERFGADPGVVAAAVAQMAPYRPEERRTERAATDPTSATARRTVTVRFEFSEDGQALGRFAIAGRDTSIVIAILDPAVTGLVVRTITDSTLIAERRGQRLTAPIVVGGVAFGRAEVTEVPTVPPGEVRVGLDLLWRFGFTIDERAGTLTLGSPGMRRGGAVTYVPVVLTFPGLSLVPRPGPVPIPVAAASARALLRGSRWWLDATQGALVVER